MNAIYLSWKLFIVLVFKYNINIASIFNTKVCWVSCYFKIQPHYRQTDDLRTTGHAGSLYKVSHQSQSFLLIPKTWRYIIYIFIIIKPIKKNITWLQLNNRVYVITRNYPLTSNTSFQYQYNIINDIIMINIHKIMLFYTV